MWHSWAVLLNTWISKASLHQLQCCSRLYNVYFFLSHWAPALAISDSPVFLVEWMPEEYSFYHQCNEILIPEAAHSPCAVPNVFKLWFMVWLCFGFFLCVCVGQLLDCSFGSSRLLLVVREGLLLKMLLRGWDKQPVSQVWLLCSTAIGSLVLLCFVLVFPLVSKCLPWLFEKPDGMLCQPHCCSTSARITNFPVIIRCIQNYFKTAYLVSTYLGALLTWTNTNIKELKEIWQRKVVLI